MHRKWNHFFIPRRLVWLWKNYWFSYKILNLPFQNFFSYFEENAERKVRPIWNKFFFYVSIQNFFFWPRKCITMLMVKSKDCLVCISLRLSCNRKITAMVFLKCLENTAIRVIPLMKYIAMCKIDKTSVFHQKCLLSLYVPVPKTYLILRIKQVSTSIS